MTMATYLIKEAKVVNEGIESVQDVLIKNGRIEKVASTIEQTEQVIEVGAGGKWLMPGCIDDQVHFREPGLTHKAEIMTEAKAAVAGGVTSFMEMPNTNPTSTTQELLQAKYDRAAQVSVANYSFYMGVTNDNADEVLRTNGENVCGIKIFMGSSTGDMLVDNESTLSRIFCNTPLLIATHCEDEPRVKARTQEYLERYGNNLAARYHAEIRDEQACYLSSSKAIEIAKKCGTRLHILHITTADELSLFNNAPLSADKKITSEVCVHHLWYSADDYEQLGYQIKCNPAIKAKSHRNALRKALQDGIIDVVATDHAPHTWDEKQQDYPKAPSGLPLVQHPLLMMLQIATEEGWSKAFVADKMAHQVARLFAIRERGFIREGYHADLVLISDQKQTVKKQYLLYKCGWSPLVGQQFDHSVEKTWVNGNLVWSDGKINDSTVGSRMLFDRR